MAIKTFRVHVSTTAGTDIIDIGPEIERIAAQAGDGATAMDTPISVPCCRAYHVPSCWQTSNCCLAGGRRLLSVVLRIDPTTGKLSIGYLHHHNTPQPA